MKTRTVSAVLLFLSLTLVITAAAQQFIDAPQFSVNGSPLFVASGDFNRDGNPDLAVGNSQGPAPISILLGSGSGSFQLGQQLGERFNSSDGLTVGDWNRDGVLDLAAPIGGTTLQIFLGVGDGTFDSGATYTHGAVGITSADLNGDGISDLITADGFGGVSVFLGVGDGTFGAPVTYGVSQQTVVSEVAVADLNGDGYPDVAGAATSRANGDGSLQVFLGNGDATLQPAVAYATAQEGYGVAIADFNRDGIPDLSTTGNSNIAVLFGNGDGSFASAQEYVGLGGSVDLAAADLDGDGAPEVLQLESTAFGFGPPFAVAVWRNKGDGTFRSPVHYGVGQDPRGIVIGDFNNDGKLDAVTANNGGETVSVLLNDGQGQLLSRQEFNAGLDESTGIAALAVGYIDKDQNLDTVVIDFDHGNVVVLPGNADGTFRQPRAYPAKLFPEAVTVADVNGDGWTDIIAAGGDAISVLLGNGIGKFQPPVSYQAGPGVDAVTTADVNNDGFLDVITGDYQGHAVSALLNDGTGKFGKQVYSYTSYRVTAVAVGDLNKDGILDVATTNRAVGNQEGSSTVLLGNGDGSFTVDHTFRFGAGHGAGSVAIADVNGDGNLDVVTLGDQVRVYLGHGDGTFGTPIIRDVAEFGGVGVVGDFNRDGKLDALVLAIDTHDINHSYLLLGNGDGSFQPAQVYGSDNFSAIAAGDFNHDGALDAVSVGGCCIDVLLNTGSK